jgi:hypothetical protein
MPPPPVTNTVISFTAPSVFHQAVKGHLVKLYRAIRLSGESTMVVFAAFNIVSGFLLKRGIRAQNMGFLRFGDLFLFNDPEFLP